MYLSGSLHFYKNICSFKYLHSKINYYIRYELYCTTCTNNCYKLTKNAEFI